MSSSQLLPILCFSFRTWYAYAIAGLLYLVQVVLFCFVWYANLLCDSTECSTEYYYVCNLGSDIVDVVIFSFDFFISGSVSSSRTILSGSFFLKCIFNNERQMEHSAFLSQKFIHWRAPTFVGSCSNTQIQYVLHYFD